MKYYGEIRKRGGRIYFYPIEAIGQAPGEEELFPGVSQATTPTTPQKVVITPKPVSPEEKRLRMYKKTAQEALIASESAQKGLLLTRYGHSMAYAFYHKKSYVKDFAGRSRVIFFNEHPDADKLTCNIPEAYFKIPAVFLGIKIDIEPTPLKDVAGAYKYLEAIQALTNSTVQLRINDEIAYTFPFKDIAPVIETDVAEVGGNEVLTIHFKPRPMVEFGDIIKANYFSIRPQDRAYLLILIDGAFPGLGSGAVDFGIKPYLYARSPRRMLGG